MVIKEKIREWSEKAEWMNEWINEWINDSISEIIEKDVEKRKDLKIKRTCHWKTWLHSHNKKKSNQYFSSVFFKMK